MFFNYFVTQIDGEILNSDIAERIMISEKLCSLLDHPDFKILSMIIGGKSTGFKVNGYSH